MKSGLYRGHREYVDYIKGLNTSIWAIGSMFGYIAIQGFIGVNKYIAIARVGPKRCRQKLC